MTDSMQLQFRLVNYRKVHPSALVSEPHYLVYFEDVWCGSIYRWPGTAEERWCWSVNGCVFVEQPDGATGVMHVGDSDTAPTLEDAKKAWREAWPRINPDLDAMRVDQENVKSLERRPVDQYAEYLRAVLRDREAFLSGTARR